MRILLAVMHVLSAAAIGMCLAQTPETGKPPTPLTLEDVVKLVHSGVSEEVVIARIKRYNRPFDLNPEEINELKKQGVSDAVLIYLLDPSKPYAPPPPPAAAPATSATEPAKVEPPPPPKDPFSLKVPTDPGVYWVRSAEPGNEAFELMELKPLVPMKTGGKLESMLTGGLKKGQTVGSLAGPSAILHIPKGPMVFYARIGKVAIDDLILLHADKGDGKRYIDFGPKPSKPVFPPESVRQFASKQVSDGFYRLEVPALQPGEYVFLVLGSGDEKKGVVGKGYDFAVGSGSKKSN